MEGEHLQENFQPIDIRNIISSKSQKLAKRIPGFIYRWLSKVLHIRELNEIMKYYGHLKGAAFVGDVLKYLDIKYQWVLNDNVSTSNKYIFVGNHPLGGADGGIILKYLNETFGDTRCLTNDFLLNMVPPLKDLFVPINKVGTQSRDSLNFVEQLYLSNDQILIFPAGLCSRKIKGKIIDLQWQKHFIQKAVQYKKDIVPIYFEGRNSNFFYNLASIRKIFRIKINIEMLFLVDELFKHQHKTFKIYVGDPIPYTTFNHSKKPLEWAQEVKNITYQLPKRG